MARVFLTGGGGFIGGQLAKALLERGDEVIGLSHTDAGERRLRDLGAHVVRGDVVNQTVVTEAMAGCDVVHHVAGVNAHCPRDPGRLWQVNVLGPQSVIRAAARHSIPRVIYTSSAATLGEAPGTVGDESSPHRGWFLSTYEQSKYVAERAAFAAAEVNGVELVALNPTSVQGPPRTGGNGAFIIAYLNHRLPAFLDTHVSLVDVQDVVAAHVLAETHGRPGRRYVLSGSTLTSEQALRLLAEVSGIDDRVRLLPGGVVRRLAQVADLAFRVRGRTSPVCPARIATILHGHRYDGSLAQRELGLAYTPGSEIFRRTVEWARSNGLVAGRRDDPSGVRQGRA